MRRYMCVFLFVISFLLCPAKSYAQAPDPSGALIQTTSFQSDFEGMAYLNLFPTAKQYHADIIQAYEAVLCTAVRIDVAGHYGSGSIFHITSEDVIIITNRHVIEYWEKDSFITFMDGQALSGQVMYVSEDYDIGFLRIPVQYFSYEELLNLRSVRYEDRSSDDLAAGESFFVLDTAKDRYHPRYYEGEVKDRWYYIEEFANYMIYGITTGYPGMSGGGMFDAWGNYIGMTTGGTEQDEIAAVPLTIIIQEYKKAAS